MGEGGGGEEVREGNMFINLLVGFVAAFWDSLPNFESHCGDSRGCYEFYLVATRDVSSYALLTPESFPVESTRVFFLVSTV